MKIVKGIVGAGAVVLTGALGVPPEEARAQTAAQAVLEEIIVTARRREESLEDLPLSVVAISADAMQAQGIYNTEQIGEFAANVSLTSSDRMNHSRIFIRGIGGGFPNPIAVFGTGMYIDGHYLPGSLANYMSTVDVERVEVLRGPQGTLFGKNVTGGAVNIISAKPAPDFGASLTMRVGDFGQQDVRGMVNTPITDSLFFRGSISSEQSDGYYENMFLGTDVGYRDTQNFRGALRWVPNENWTIDATYQHSKERNGQLGAQCALRPDSSIRDNMLANGVNPADLAGIAFYDDDPATSYPDGVSQWGGSSPANPGGHIDRLGPITTNGQAITTDGNTSVLTMWDWCNAQVAAGDFTLASEKDDFADADSDSVFFSADWSSEGPVGGLDNLEIRTNASWRFTTFNWILDRDYTPLPIDTLGHVDEGDGSNLTTRNLEVIFDMAVSDRLNVLAGIYLFEEQSRTGDGNCWPKWSQMYETYDISTGQRPGDPAGLGIDVFGPDTPCGQGSGGGDHGGLVFEFLPDRENPGGPGNAYQNVNLYNDSTAVFAHMTYALSDNWDLEAGARWTEDKRHFNIIEFESSDSCHFVGQTLCQPTPVLNYANVVEGGFFNEVEETFSEVTPMVSLTRNLTPGDTIESGMVYVLYSEGFLTGSFNDELNIFLTPELTPLVTYGPEHVTNYEFGFKGTFADGRVRLNADVFWMDYEDKQEGIELDNQDGQFGPDPSIELTQNAGQVDIYGIELELRASPWDGGFVTVDASYLENEYSEFLVDDVENPGQQKDLSNNVINDRTPDWTLNVSVGHTFTLGNGGTLTPTIGVYAQGGYEWLAMTATVPTLSDPHSYCYQDAYEKWRARLTYVPPSQTWEASLYGSNITDERYYEQCEWARTGVYKYRYGAPDAWGLEFVARWGEN